MVVKNHTNSKKVNSLLFSLLLSVVFFGIISAADIANDLHLNLQVINTNGTVAQSTAFAFIFNISNSTSCADANIVYSNSSTLTTDARGIISTYLHNVTLSFNQQYWLCYYRAGTLIDTVSMAKTPYSYKALSVNLTNLTVNTNFNATAYNITNVSSGLFIFLGDLVSRVTTLFVTNISATGDINTTGSINATGTVLSQGNNLSLGYFYATNSTSWSAVTNGTMASWANSVNGTLAINSTIASWATNNFLASNGSNGTGTWNFNGGWQSNGLTIQSGDLYAQTVFVYNLTALSVNNLLINGSMLPQRGWDNVFDIGNASLRWRNITLGGNASINGSVYIFNNITLGDTSADYIIVNGLVASHFTPIDNARDLGTAANRWRTVYVDVLNSNNLSAANVSIAGTQFDTFTIFSNNTGDDAQNSSLAFERGTPSINAVIKWDSTNGSKRFDFNFPAYFGIDTNLTIDNFFFADSLNNRLGVNTTTPQNTLNVKGSFNVTNDTGTPGFFVNSSGYVGINSSSPQNVLNVIGTLNVTNGTNSIPGIVVNINNRLGVATGTPQNTLNVVGDANITGTVYAAGNVNLTTGYLYATNSSYASWANVVNGTMASWANVINGTVIQGTNVTYPYSINGSQWSNTGNYSNFSTIVYGYAINGSLWSATANYSNFSTIIYPQLFNGSTAKTNAANSFLNFNQSFNVALLFLYQNVNFTGINTSTPQNTLNVIGTLNVTNGTNSIPGLNVDVNNSIRIGEPCPTGQTTVCFLTPLSVISSKGDGRLAVFGTTATNASGIAKIQFISDTNAQNLVIEQFSINATEQPIGLSGRVGGIRTNNEVIYVVGETGTAIGAGTKEGIRVTTTPNVGISTTTPQNTLNVVGAINGTSNVYLAGVSAAANGNAACFSTSGELQENVGVTTCLISGQQYKQNISYDFPYGLNELMRLKPATYKYINGDNRTRMGLIAQDVGLIIPNAVVMEQNKINKINEITKENMLVENPYFGQSKTYNSDELLTLVIKSIQDQQNKINQMRGTLCKLNQVEYC